MIQPQPQPQQLSYQYAQSPYAPHPQQLTPTYQQPHHHQQQHLLAPQPPAASPPSRKRKAPGASPYNTMSAPTAMSPTGLGDTSGLGEQAEEVGEQSAPTSAPKKSRTNTPWSPAEEQRLRIMREAGNTWGEIAKVRRVWGHWVEQQC